ncbi:MAG: PEP/pyruvate-binding domain-containing protein [Candidatus Eisenbacteria bacterium]|uniref:Phosphoenolpyruvate synthase n=1 Tax=Eiseniibacteriota bacterium TaxID=2212470 RepID=A0A948RSQ2_UNCEI|nr:PEP/pyruvate-binding domain-containing protein [Candidatus Eisenbacteria bacterium]MBU1947660.1 PEP/pyruvate-binding domain-containing protein [Candidatus Eisenbacteria bacterium]MBU2690180.1 PEP/pyruvate-binding domain-containing protein [Candidatus Eisenbacteria bacterium]
MPEKDHSKKEKRRHIEGILKRFPELSKRISRTLLITLHSRGIISVDEAHRLARGRARGKGSGKASENIKASDNLHNDNIQLVQRWDEKEKRQIHEITLDYAAEYFTEVEIDDLVNLTRKREEAQTLGEIADLASVSSGLLIEKIKSFCRLPKGQTILPAQESLSVRVALIRRFISDQLEFIGIAKHHLYIRDFDDLVSRIIGDENGAGLIGGKAGGNLLGERILTRAQNEDPHAPNVRIHTPESYYLRSDILDTFLRYNGLQHLQDQKYKEIADIRNDYPMILDLFKNADFPPDLVSMIRDLLKTLGSHPLIVRSSSLLEDRFGTTFAGKYRSVFVSNQGSEESRVQELLGAIAEVYASTLHPDPLSYRRRHDLLDYSENMAVLIQKLVGTRVGSYFLPVWAGVGFSRNLYRRNPRIRPEDGMTRLVFGLGTRAVDRVSEDFPRIIPLGLPTLRPEIKPEDILRVSQKFVDVVNLETHRFETIPISSLLQENAGMPGLSHVFSVLKHGFIRQMMGDGILDRPEDLVVTFDRLTHSTPYPAFLKWCLQTLEKAYQCPIDIEFAYDGEHFYLLQCRPQAMRREETQIRLPAYIPPERTVFTANRDIISARVSKIEYVILIDPKDYNMIHSTEKRLGVAKIVHQLNDKLSDKVFILMGPGRWGSKDLRLGIRVGYSDINNTRILIEIARREGGYMPEVSYGSHFFQDLVESNIQYLALYPDDPDICFNTDFLHKSKNSLPSILPDARDFIDVVRVLHVPGAASGMLLQVEMDGDNQQAMAYLI